MHVRFFAMFRNVFLFHSYIGIYGLRPFRDVAAWEEVLDVSYNGTEDDVKEFVVVPPSAK